MKILSALLSNQNLLLMKKFYAGLFTATTALCAAAVMPGHGQPFRTPFQKPTAIHAPFQSNNIAVSPPEAIAASPLRAPEESPKLPIPQLIGNVLWPQNAPNYLAMCALPTEPEAEMRILSPNGVTSNGGGVEIDGVYWSATHIGQEGFDEQFLFSYDAETWEQLTFTTTDLGMIAHDVALDPVSKKVYGCFYNDDGTGSVFGTVDYPSQVRTVIAPVATAWSACAVDTDGTVYAIDYYGKLFTVDKTTGVMTEIGDTGLSRSYITSGCIDPHSGRFFFVYYKATGTKEESFLYEINKQTAEATLIYQLPGNEQIVGMYVAPPKAAWDAPAAPTNLAADFSGGSLSGTVSFKVPALTYEGNPAEGPVSFAITASGTELKKGETTFGAEVAGQVTLPAAGLYTLEITLTNNAGSSPAAQLEKYVGHDTPATPAVTAWWTETGMEISWQPITTGIHAGFIDTDAVTYTVTRLNDNHTVAKDITATSVTDPFPEPEQLTAFTYAVTASANGLTSQPATSNTVGVGPVEPPYTQDFQSDEAFANLTVINVEETTKEWYHYTGHYSGNKWARIGYDSSNAKDDWLITPSIRLEAGKIYILHFDVCKEGGAANIERIEVKFGRDKTVAAMTETAFSPTDVTDNAFTTHTCHIEPTETGNYHIGFHACSDKDRFWLGLDNIRLEAGAIAGAPDVVQNLQVTAGSYGARKAEIAFTAPSVAFDGTPLTELTAATIYRNGTPVKKFDTPAPTPGSLCLFTDEGADLLPGTHVYTVTASNAAGEGKPVTAEVFVGTKKTVAPKGVKITETIPGNVTLTWQAPDKDVDGALINPATLKYHVVEIKDGEQTIIAQNATSTSLRYEAVPKGEQAFLAYGVFAESDGGLSDAAISDMAPVGTPYAIPYAESFANGTASSIFGSVTDMGKADWGIFTDKSVSGVTSCDADNGFAGMEGSAYNDRASLLTGKFDLTQAAAPLFEFCVFHMKGSVANENPIEILINDGTGFNSIATIEVGQTGEANTWNPVTVMLHDYANKVVSIKLAGKVDSYKYTFIDAMRIYDKSSAIEAIGSDDMTDNAITIGATDGTITVDGAQDLPVAIHNIAGVTIFRTDAAPASLAVPAVPGIYIVKAGKTTAKVALR